MVVRAVNHQYFSALIAFTEYCPVSQFRVSQSLLDKRDSEIHLQGCFEKFSVHLRDKITQIHSSLEQAWGGSFGDPCGTDLHSYL